MALTQDQSLALQRITGNVESGYQAMARAKTSLSVLIAAGKATCQEVRAYNLYTTAIYNFQKATLQTVRGAGQNDVPEKPPLPVYVMWKGVTGDKAINIDCAQAQMQGTVPTGSGDFYVDANKVEFRVGTDTTDSVPIATISEIVKAAKTASGQPSLGEPITLTTIAIIGIVVALVAAAAVALTYLYSDLKGREEETKQIDIQAKQYEKTLAARAACFDACIQKGNSPADCTKACATTLPPFDPEYKARDWGLFATIGAITVVGVIGAVAYRQWKRHHGDGMDGYEDDEDADSDEHDLADSSFAPGKTYRMLPNGVIDVR